MVSDTPGIHHVTAMVGDAQANLDFHVGVLGLRLVKRTVNHEDVLRYHLYYGNGTGDLGTVYTCFPYPEEPPGRRGVPQWAAVSFAVPEGSLDFWADRLADHSVETERRQRFGGESLLRFEDPAGTRLELVAADSAVEPWREGPVPADVAIRGIHGATALPADPFRTASVLETLGLDHVGQDGDRVRYRAGGDHGTVLDLLDRGAGSGSATEHERESVSGFGREGPGTVHHVAVRVPDDDLMDWHDLFRERGVQVSRVRDRHYYRSVYVRPGGGVLVELASEKPGFTVDEAVDSLGESLVLPPWAEDDREMVEGQLPPVEVPAVEDWR
ncbi:VOC family protein [Haloglomus halophilum]|uniref:VOC family protein n=1 Tax=Haloglomus halophilum TaxID=2962672 RepID=UPI0020C9A864|nr:VOC family protein [Haloglomus halophilum]